MMMGTQSSAANTLRTVRQGGLLRPVSMSEIVDCFNPDKYANSFWSIARAYRRHWTTS